jgi:hypothetical protein
VGVWAVIAGLVEFSAAFRSGEPAGTRAILILGGLVTIAFGVVLCARPGIGAITLALLFGLFNLIAAAGGGGVPGRNRGGNRRPACAAGRRHLTGRPRPARQVLASTLLVVPVIVMLVRASRAARRPRSSWPAASAAEGCPRASFPAARRAPPGTAGGNGRPKALPSGG